LGDDSGWLPHIAFICFNLIGYNLNQPHSKDMSFLTSSLRGEAMVEKLGTNLL